MGLDDRGPGGLLLVGVPRRRVEGLAVGEVCRHGAHHLRRLVETAQELVDIDAARRLDRFPATIDQNEPGAALAHLGCRPGGDDRPEPMPGEDDPVPGRGQQPRALGDRENVAGEGGFVVALGRRVGESVATEVHRHDPSDRPQPARDGCPRPGGVGESMDEQDPGAPARPDHSPTPVQEMDPVARVDDDNEAVGLGSEVRRRHGLHRP